MPTDGASSFRGQSGSRPLVQRVEVGALYTEGQELWEVVEVHALGTVTLINDDMSERTIGIDAFRSRFWLVRVPATARGQLEKGATDAR